MMNISLDVVDESFEDSDAPLTPKSQTGRNRKRNVGTKKLYKCTHCSKIYKNVTFFHKHVLNKHQEEKQSPKCDSIMVLTEIGQRLKEKTLNNNDLPAIDAFKIFEEPKKSTYVNCDYVQTEIPPSPYSDDCSNFSVDSAVSTTSNISNFNEAITFPYNHYASNSNFCSTTSDSSQASDFSPAANGYEEIRHDAEIHDAEMHDKDILMILKSELEKNFVDVVLSFN